MENINHLKSLEVSDSDVDTLSSDDGVWSINDSVQATMKFGSDDDEAIEGSVHGGTVDLPSPRPSIGRMAADPSLENKNLARCNHDGGYIQNVTGPEDSNVGTSPRQCEINVNGPPVVQDEAFNNAIGSINLLVGSLESGPNSQPLPVNDPNPATHNSTTFLSAPNVVCGDPLLNSDNPTSTHRRASSLRRISKVKTKKSKTNKAPFDPKVWKDFINPMASWGDLDDSCRRKKKKHQNYVDAHSTPDCNTNDGGGWVLGKKLGLTSNKTDAEMEKILRGVEIDSAGLGARVDNSK